MGTLFAQNERPTAEPPTAEPPTIEPPTLEPPTTEPPTAEPPTTEPPTTESPTIEPPTATFTELPSLTPTETLTLSPTLTPTATLTETATASPTATTTITVTPSLTATAALMPAATASAVLARPLPTPGAPDYAGRLQAARSRLGQTSALTLNGECSTSISPNIAIVAPPSSGPAEDFYAAVAQAHNTSTSPYPIYLCPGEFPLDETVVLFADIIIYGQGLDEEGGSTLYQSNTISMGGMFTLNGNLLEFHNVYITGGQALQVIAGAVQGGVVKIWDGTLRIYDSKIEDNQANDVGGAVAWGGTTYIERSYLIGNQTIDFEGGGLAVGNVSANCVRFELNQAGTYGGAMAINGVGPINNSSFIDNIALDGDGNHIDNGGGSGNADASENLY